MADFSQNLRPAPQADGAAALARERASSSLLTDDLTNHLFAGDGFLERQERILALLEKEPLFNKVGQVGQSRPERLHVALKRAKRLRQLAEVHHWGREEAQMAGYLIDDPLPFDLHAAMFLTTLRQQASDEQQAMWLEKAEKYQLIGAYAQTELGHGSNVRGVETQAIWDQKTQTFVLHSPTITASKWWIGGLGRVAQYAVVVAQLLVPNDAGNHISYGPHTFVVQIRDLETHQALPGIIIGDIGPKLGYQTMDNGYMLFNQYRIPHISMLSRFSKLDPQTGVYSKPQNPGLMYGSMTYARTKIIENARLVLARAVTIAIRYTCIRRQFADKDQPGSEEEITVLDYPTVQIRLFPLLATAFALHYAGRMMSRVYDAFISNTNTGDVSGLANVHGISSGLKSIATGLTADGIEICRRTLGGHGFGGSSGFPLMIQSYLSKPTVEGDNWMITQQLALFLMKKAGVALDKSAKTDDPWVQRLRAYRKDNRGTGPLNVLESDGAIVEAFQWRAAALTFKVYEARVTQKQPLNGMLIEMHKLSNAQSTAYMVEQFYLGVQNDDDLPQATKAVLLKLFRLFSFYTMQNNAMDFLNSSTVSIDVLNQLESIMNGLMAEIRPHALKLVDAWRIPDYLLNSALGRSDGKVYESLFHDAHVLNPLNKITFDPRYWVDDIYKTDIKTESSRL